MVVTREVDEGEGGVLVWSGQLGVWLEEWLVFLWVVRSEKREGKYG